jgi:hypothetical protein
VERVNERNGGKKIKRSPKNRRHERKIHSHLINCLFVMTAAVRYVYYEREDPQTLLTQTQQRKQRRLTTIGASLKQL